MDISLVTVAGAGVLGTQIAYQAAFHGYEVQLFDVDEQALTTAKQKMEQLQQAFQRDLNTTADQTRAAVDRLSYSTNLEAAVANADLLIEAVPENMAIKKEFYTKANRAAPHKTIFATNTSTLLPSQLAEATGRPGRFLALHFANEIWKNNTAEVMGHKGTEPAVFDGIVKFAQSIGMVALPLQKEQPGYILNSLLVPLLTAATDLATAEVANPHTIDKTWMLATGAPRGPFAILDVIGLKTAYNVNANAAEASGDPKRKKAMQFLKEQFIDRGKLGTATGEGFYSYPNPAYADPDFLK